RRSVASCLSVCPAIGWSHGYCIRYTRANSDLMRILMSGARGLIGSDLSAILTAHGHEFVELTRRSVGGDGIEWSPDEGRIETDKLLGFDAVVHLAGEPIFGRWTAEKKRKIRESRVQGTRLLCSALAGLGQDNRPKVL